ncbi:DoxX family protein [Peterkaempfera griseoplana]|uniref:DoxX family protein n=1 Tax=Peterkaempfera griseoplana TaxID=66896 RepID=UPI0006E2F020|nr:DoxX family protein [Peterkaempfera griseoplana]
MPVLRMIARPMLASMFVVGGLDAVRRPARLAPMADKVVKPLAERFPGVVPESTEQAVRLNGAVQLTAGVLLALGRRPRPAALALAATLVPVTWAGHRFWEAEDPAEREQQLIHLLKNVSMMGGLLLAAADTAGRPSLAWRGRHAVHSARHDVAVAARTARATRGPAMAAGRLQGRIAG